jgi:hypothetical protein
MDGASKGECEWMAQQFRAALVAHDTEQLLSRAGMETTDDGDEDYNPMKFTVDRVDPNLYVVTSQETTTDTQPQESPTPVNHNKGPVTPRALDANRHIPDTLFDVINELLGYAYNGHEAVLESRPDCHDLLYPISPYSAREPLSTRVAQFRRRVPGGRLGGHL